eukprot:13658880-Heterocapsa_arctica.AAC.1
MSLNIAGLDLPSHRLVRNLLVLAVGRVVAPCTSCTEERLQPLRLACDLVGLDRRKDARANYRQHDSDR